MREVILAKSAGFCFGVRRAVELAQQVAQSGQPYVMLGPVIHNDHVIADLEAQGVRCVASLEEVPPGCGVIIRSHGEGKAVYDQLAAMGCPVADATCVKVAHIHEIVKDASDRGRQVIIIGAPAMANRCISYWILDLERFDGAIMNQDLDHIDKFRSRMHCSNFL